MIRNISTQILNQFFYLVSGDSSILIFIEKLERFQNFGIQSFVTRHFDTTELYESMKKS